MRTVDVAIVGAGHNGLTCAALLAGAGLDVVVLERRARAGGAAATEELLPGYRFPTCAYVVHLLEPEVLRAIGIAEEELRLLPLPPRRVVLGGEVLDENEPPEWEQVGAVLGAFALRDAPAEEELLAEARRQGAEDAVARFARESLRALGLAGTLGPPYFEADPDEAGGPLAHAWTKRPGLGPAVPEGGMGTVAAAFERAARAAGAELRLGVPVERIAPGRGVVAAGEEVRARAVVSSAPPPATLRLAGVDAASPPLGPGAAKLHVALDGEPDLSLVGAAEELGLVHVVPADDWLPRAAAEVRDGRFPESGLVELQLPTLRDRSLAPPGGHCLSVFLPHAPPRVEGGWDARRDELGEHLLALAERAIPNLRGLVTGAVVHTPADLERRVGLPGGAIHHLPHVPALMGRGRPGPATGVEGLFLCGAGTHPGGELSGAPGANAARAVLEALAV